MSLILQVEYSKEIGIPLAQGALLVPYMSIASAVGRIAFGKLSDLIGHKTLNMYRICMFLSGLWTVLLPSMSIRYSMLILYVVILGLLDGSFIGLMSVVTFQVAEGEDLSEAWGLILTVESVMMMLGPPAAGKESKQYGGCDPAMLIKLATTKNLMNFQSMNQIPSTLIPILQLNKTFKFSNLSAYPHPPLIRQLI